MILPDVNVLIYAFRADTGNAQGDVIVGELGL